MIRYWLTTMAVSFLSLARAQTSNWAGTDNYLGISAAEMNPAMAANISSNWMVSPVRTDLFLHNNFISLKMPYSPYTLLFNNYPDKYTSPTGHAMWDWDWMYMNPRVKTVNLQTLNRIMGPSFIIKKGKWAWSFRTDITNNIAIAGLPAQIVRDELKSLMETGKTGLPGVPTGDSTFPGNIMVRENKYLSIGFGLARKWTLKNQQDIMVGFNYRFLRSLGGYYFQSRSGNIAYDPKNGIVFNSPSLYFAEMLPRNNYLRPYGTGGIDLGAAWTYRNPVTLHRWGYEKTHPDYKFKLGFSILDIGHLLYTRTISTKVQINSSVNLPKPEDLQKLTPEQLRDQFRNVLQKEVSVDNTTVYGKKIRVGLPTRMVLNFDLQLRKHVFISTLLIQNVRKKMSNNIQAVSSYMVGPRLEYKYFSISTPITYFADERTVAPGFSLRFFQFFMGTRNIVPWVHTYGAHSADIYFGLQITNLPGAFIKKRMPYLFIRRKGCAEF